MPLLQRTTGEDGVANSQAYGQALFATLAETFWCSIYGILSSRADEWVFLGGLSLLIFI